MITTRALRFLKLRDGARLPMYATQGASALDLASPDWVVVPPGETLLVPMGWAVAIPEGHGGLLLSRSGHSKVRVRLANSVGLIDADYRSEVGVMLENGSDRPFDVAPGDRIAQLAIVEMPKVTPVWVGSMPALETDRDGGWGSTGGNGSLVSTAVDLIA